MNKEGGKVGDRSIGEVIEITNKKGGMEGEIFL